MPAASPSTCPRCGAAASGRFCANCGAALAGSTCTSCRAPLTPGALFCHQCGTPAGTAGTAARAPRSIVPWAVAGTAAIALIALVVVQRVGESGANVGSTSANAPNGGGLGANASGSGAPPDISMMSEVERARRLFNRIMELHTAGLSDSARGWAPMALGAYDMIDSLDADLRYEMGRIAEVTGVPEVAKAQADTILKNEPNHLLGLVLAGKVARIYGDTTAAKRYDQALLAAEKSELAKGKQEYQDHKLDLDQALAEARKARGG